MQQYYPRVQCRSPRRLDRALNATACQLLLDRMLTTTSSQIFGQRGAPGVEVPLTQRFSSGTLNIHEAPNVVRILTKSAANGDCSIALLMDGPPVLVTWHEIWGAAVSVAGMCVRYSKLGTAIVQCTSQQASTSVRSGANNLISREL